MMNEPIWGRTGNDGGEGTAYVGTSKQPVRAIFTCYGLHEGRVERIERKGAMLKEGQVEQPAASGGRP